MCPDYRRGAESIRRFAAPERQFVVAKAPSGQQSALSGQLKIVFLSAYALRVRIRTDGEPIGQGNETVGERRSHPAGVLLRKKASGIIEPSCGEVSLFF